MAKATLSEKNIENVQTQIKGKYEKHTKTTRKEEDQNITAVEHLFNVLEPTKSLNFKRPSPFQGFI